MNKNTARNVADALTWARIWSLVPLTALAWFELRWWFLGLYMAAALTDWFDGFFGRRAAPPKSDVDLDGNADILFSIMTLVWIWMLVPGFYQEYWFPYLPLLAMIQLYLWFAVIRLPGLRSPHFQFGRFGMAVFCLLLPVLIVFGDQPWFVHAVFVVGIVGKLQLARHFARLSRVRTDKVGQA